MKMTKQINVETCLQLQQNVANLVRLLGHTHVFTVIPFLTFHHLLIPFNFIIIRRVVIAAFDNNTVRI